MQACAGPRVLPLLVAVAALVLLPGSTAELNAAGQPLMTPTAAVAGNRSYLFELPVAPGERWDDAASHEKRRLAPAASAALAEVPSTDGKMPWLFSMKPPPASCAAVGVLVMLHRCGRNAEDFWPPSSVCPQCIGMPEAVSISRQALARGYALLAINSANRTVGSAGRCFRCAA